MNPQKKKRVMEISKMKKMKKMFKNRTQQNKIILINKYNYISISLKLKKNN